MRKAATADYMPIMQPLTGGLPLDRAWRCMELFGEVMGEGLIVPLPPCRIIAADYLEAVARSGSAPVLLPRPG
jgi:hypothetical protein